MTIPVTKPEINSLLCLDLHYHEKWWCSLTAPKLLVTFVELVPGESAWSDFFVRARDVVFFVSRHCECQCRSRCPIDWLLQNSSQWPLPAVHQTHISIRFNSILAPLMWILSTFERLSTSDKMASPVWTNSDQQEKTVLCQFELWKSTQSKNGVSQKERDHRRFDF